MDSNTCRVCHNNTKYLMAGVLKDKYAVSYFECSHCGYVQTEQPYWLEDAYSDAISYTDTGILQRNLYNSNNVIVVLWLLSKLHGKVVDYAGGYGLLSRLLRDYGVDAYWADKYCENIFAKGFEYKDTDKKVDLLTAFEVFEHLVNPSEEFTTMFDISSNIFGSTLLISGAAPAIDQWWYYGVSHGQHIGFFRLETLKFLAQKHGKHLVTNGTDLHLFLNKKINTTLFKTALKCGTIFSKFIKRSLTSKTFSDYELGISKFKKH